jgi:hypothetical protein
MEYAQILMTHLTPKLLETNAIKISYHLPPWTRHIWTYKPVEPITDHLKRLAIDFLVKNSSDPLIRELIQNLQFIRSAQSCAK